MRRLPLIFIFSLLLFSSVSCQKQVQNKTAVKPEIEKGWKLVDLEIVTFLLPESMEDQHARGKDSAVWEFKDSDLELYIDYGPYSNDFSDLKNSYEVKTEDVTIDGKSVTLFSWDQNKNISGTSALNANGSRIPYETFTKHFCTGVYFQLGEQGNEGINFEICAKTLERQETVKKVLLSIKFK